MSAHPNRSRLRKQPGYNPSRDEVRELQEDFGDSNAEFARRAYASVRAVEDWRSGARRMHPLAFEYLSLLECYPEVRAAREDWLRRISEGE